MAAYPCTDDPGEIIESVVGAGENAEKFDKFVNGGVNEEVQLGSGSPTPTLRNTVHLVKSAAATLDGADVSGKFADAANGGTVLRTLSERFGDIVNVKDFGAVGDGVADDASAIQDAFDFAGTDKLVWFPAGTYLVSETVAGSCDIAGSGVGSSVLKMESASGESETYTPVLLWQGDQLQKTIRSIAIEAGNGCEGLKYIGTGRIAIDDVYVNLLGDGVGIRMLPSNSTSYDYAVSRLFRMENVSILGCGGYTTAGIIAYNSMDSRIVNSEIMGCRTGLDIRSGTGHLFMSDVHIWCGDTTRSNAVWWEETQCINIRTPTTITATNLYLDSAKNPVGFSHPVRFFVHNFTYWEGYYEYLSEINGQMFYSNSDDAKAKSYAVLDGGIINARYNMKNPSYGILATTNDVYVVAGNDISFSNDNLKLPKTWKEKKSNWTVKLEAGKYTPVAYSFNRYGGFCRFSLSSTTGAASYDISITEYRNIKCKGYASGQNLYYSYDENEHILIFYMYTANAGEITVTPYNSDMNHYLFVTPLILGSDAWTPFTGDALDSSSSLTAVAVENA